MAKRMEELEYKELVDYCTGDALMRIGSGESFRNVICMLISQVTRWSYENVTKPQIQAAAETTNQIELAGKMLSKK